MTERLTQLLRAEAAELPVPPVPTAALLRRGRRLRTRRRAGSAVAVAAALAVVAGSAALLQHTFAPGPSSPPTRLADPLAAYQEGGAYAVGSTVWFGDGRSRVDVQGRVKALYYTSAGVVVRAGQVPWTDDAGPSHYALASPDGRLTPLSLTLGDVKPGTSPGSPYVAYAERAGSDRSRWRLHFYDVRTGRDASTTTVAGAFTWGGWAAPPVALDGDTAYVGLDDAMVAVDRTTGRSRRLTTLPPAYFPTVAGGHAERPASTAGDLDEVVDVADGDVVLGAASRPAGVRPREAYSFTRLSPDGRFALRSLETFGRRAGAPAATVHDLSTGRSRPVTGGVDGLGWTPDGDLLRVTRSRVSVCDPVTGTCTVHPVDLGRGVIRIGGNDNES